MTDVNESFEKLLGRQATDEDRQSLYRIRDALNLKNNDALWLVLFALQYYQNQYEKFPHLISMAAKNTMQQFIEAADASINATVEKAKLELINEKNTPKSNENKSWTNLILVLVVFLCGAMIACAGYYAGKQNGYSDAIESIKFQCHLTNK